MHSRGSVDITHADLQFIMEARGRKPSAHAEAFSASLHVHAADVVFHVTCGADPSTVLVTPRRFSGISIIHGGPVVVRIAQDPARTMAAILDVCATDLTTMRQRPGEALRPESGPIASTMATVNMLWEAAEAH